MPQDILQKIELYIFEKGAPFFAISLGESHRYFEITAEVHFSPAGSSGEHTELLLQRHYNVQAFEKTEVEQQPNTQLPLDSLPSPLPEIDTTDNLD